MDVQANATAYIRCCKFSSFYSYVKENENIGREIRADDIKTMSLSGKIEETLPVNSIEMN